MWELCLQKLKNHNFNQDLVVKLILNEFVALVHYLRIF